MTSHDPPSPWQRVPPPPPVGGDPPPGGPWVPPGGAPDPVWGAGYPGRPAPAVPQWGFGQGPVPLRPMTLGDMLDGAFRLYLANWRTVLLVAGVFLVPLQLASAFFQRDLFGGLGFLELLSDPAAAEAFAEGSAGLGPSIASLVSGLAAIIVLPFIAGAVSKVVAASYLGQPMEWGDALRATARRWWSLVAAWLLTHLLQGLPYLVGFALVFAGIALESIPVVIVGGFALLGGVAANVAIMALFVPVAPAIVIEELGPVQAMRRSVRLVRPGFWRVLAAAVVSGLLAGILSSIVGGIPSMAAFFIGLDRAWLLLAAGSIVSGLLATPFIAIVATLVYFDGRIRGEGFDLQAMAAELDRGALAAG